MKKPSDDLVISLSDIYKICRQAKRKIILGSSVVGVLAFAYALQRPIHYNAEASFREKTNSTSGLPNASIAALFLNGQSDSSNSEAVSLMKSRRIMTAAVEKLGLQGTLTPTGFHFPFLRNIWGNLVTESYYLRNKKTLPLSDREEPVTLAYLSYKGEVPTDLYLQFTSDDTFEVFKNNKEWLGKGTIGTPFSAPEITFTLQRTSIPSSSYSLHLTPMPLLFKTLIANIKIKQDRDDSSLILINFRHPNRFLASAFVNELMNTLRFYLKEEQNRISQEQIAYLEKREDEMTGRLTNKMEEYAAKLQEEVSHEGFPNTTLAMEFLAGQQQNAVEKIHSIELEVQRLKATKERKFAYEDTYHSGERYSNISHLLSEIRKLKTLGDNLEIALQNSPFHNPEGIKTLFAQQSKQLEEVKKCCKEVQILTASVEHDQLPPRTPHLFSNPNYLAKEWHEKASKDWPKIKEQYAAYLTNLSHYLHVQEKSLEEKLTHQQGPKNAFEGVQLDTANELYIGFSKELNKVEAQLAENAFITHQLQEPGFEITSLISVLEDPVSRGIIENASKMVMAIKDDINRSAIEKERLKKDLETQERFLLLHVVQTRRVLELRRDLLQEKLYALQNTTLGLIHQQISILDQQLADYIHTHIQNLEREKTLAENYQQQIRTEMAKLPQKWISETLIAQHLKMNEKMVEELSRLVETKNISNNLEIIQSSAIDTSTPSTHPQHPRLIFFAILGATLGLLGTVSTTLVGTIRRGIPATKDNLEFAEKHVSGELTLTDKDIATYRRLIAFITTGSHKSLLILKGNGFDFSDNLATLLSKQGFKVLLFPINFKTPSQTPGLLQALEKGTDPEIHHGKSFDTLTEGGSTPFGYELIRSEKFKKLMKTLQEQYDWVICISNMKGSSPEAQGLLSQFDTTAILITDDPLPQVIKLSHPKITFVIAG